MITSQEPLLVLHNTIFFFEEILKLKIPHMEESPIYTVYEI